MTKCLDIWWYYLQGLLLSLQGLRTALRSIHGSLKEDLVSKLVTILDLVEYNLYFASAWLLRDSKCLLKMLQPLFVAFSNAESPHDIDMGHLNQLFPHIGELIAQNFLTGVDYNHQILAGVPTEQSDDIVHSIPVDERWHIIGACLWQHMSRFVKHKLAILTNKSKEGNFGSIILGNLFTWAPSLSTMTPDQKDILKDVVELISMSLTSLLATVLARVSSYQLKQLVSSLQHKLDQKLYVATVVWFEHFSQTQSRQQKHHTDEEIYNMDMCNEGDFETLWNITSNPNIISECFAHEKVNLLHCFDHKLSEIWSDIYNGTTRAEDTCTREGALVSSSSSNATVSPGKLFGNGKTLVRSDKELATLEDVMSFQKSKEIYRRSGELLEVIFNPIICCY